MKTTNNRVGVNQINFMFALKVFVDLMILHYMLNVIAFFLYVLISCIRFCNLQNYNNTKTRKKKKNQTCTKSRTFIYHKKIDVISQSIQNETNQQQQ